MPRHDSILRDEESNCFSFDMVIFSEAQGGSSGNVKTVMKKHSGTQRKATKSLPLEGGGNG
jgi:hypothetical protein